MDFLWDRPLQTTSERERVSLIQSTSMLPHDEVGRGFKPHGIGCDPVMSHSRGWIGHIKPFVFSSSMTRWSASQNPLEINAATPGGYGRRTERFPTSPAMRSSRPRRRMVFPVTLGALFVFCIMLVLAARGIRKNDHMDLLLSAGGASRVKERRAMDADLPRKVRAEGQLWEARTTGEEDERDSWFKSDDEGQRSDSTDSEKDSEEKVENENEGWMGDGQEDADATSLDGNENEDTSLVDNTESATVEKEDEMQGEHLPSKGSSVDNEDGTFKSVTTEKAEDEIPQIKAEKTEQREVQERQGSGSASANASDESGSIKPDKKIAYDFDDLQFTDDAKTDEDTSTSQTKSQGKREDESKTLADFYEERYEEMMSEEKNEKAERSELSKEKFGDKDEQKKKVTQSTESLKAGKNRAEERYKDEVTASGNVSQVSQSSVAQVGIQDQALTSKDQERLNFEDGMSASDTTDEYTSTEDMKH